MPTVPDKTKLTALLLAFGLVAAACGLGCREHRGRGQR